MSDEKKQIPWATGRKNLLEMYKKFPNTIVDIIDSAYLAGLEAVEDRTELEQSQKTLNLIADIQAILAGYDHKTYESGRTTVIGINNLLKERALTIQKTYFPKK